MVIDVDVDGQNDGFVALSPPPQRETLVTEPTRPERSSVCLTIVNVPSSTPTDPQRYCMQRVKPIIERRTQMANAQTSSPTPGSQAERGVLALKVSVEMRESLQYHLYWFKP